MATYWTEQIQAEKNAQIQHQGILDKYKDNSKIKLISPFHPGKYLLPRHRFSNPFMLNSTYRNASDPNSMRDMYAGRLLTSTSKQRYTPDKVQSDKISNYSANIQRQNNFLKSYQGKIETGEPLNNQYLQSPQINRTNLSKSPKLITPKQQKPLSLQIQDNLQSAAPREIFKHSPNLLLQEIDKKMIGKRELESKQSKRPKSRGESKQSTTKQSQISKQRQATPQHYRIKSNEIHHPPSLKPVKTPRTERLLNKFEQQSQKTQEKQKVEVQEQNQQILQNDNVENNEDSVDMKSEITEISFEKSEKDEQVTQNSYVSSSVVKSLQLQLDEEKKVIFYTEALSS